MESNFQYQLSLKAKADLEHIVSYIAINLSNPKAASKFIDKLNNTIDVIYSFPESEIAIDNTFITKENVRMKTIDHYNLYYLPYLEEKMIYVLRILYNKRNISEILLQLEF